MMSPRTSSCQPGQEVQAQPHILGSLRTMEFDAGMAGNGKFPLEKDPTLFPTALGTNNILCIVLFSLR